MPSPSAAVATQRPDLASSLEEFDIMMDMAGFIAHRVYPIIDVIVQAGNFGKIPIESLLQNRETRRAPGTSYSRGNWKFEPSTFNCEEHGFEEPIDDREAKMYANYFNAELIATNRAMRAVMENAEKRVAAAVFNATTYTSQKTAVSNEWDDKANATPIADVEAAVQAVYDQSGLWPNALIMNKKVFRNLRHVAEIIDRVKYQGFQDVRAEQITASALAQVFDLDHIIVAGGTKNTANEGATAVPGQIWSGEYAMVCRVAESEDPREPCLGRTFHWSGDGSEEDGRVETYREEKVRSDVVRVRHDVDEVDLHVEAGHLLENITT